MTRIDSGSGMMWYLCRRLLRSNQHSRYTCNDWWGDSHLWRCLTHKSIRVSVIEDLRTNTQDFSRGRVNSTDTRVLMINQCPSKHVVFCSNLLWPSRSDCVDYWDVFRNSPRTRP